MPVRPSSYAPRNENDSVVIWCPAYAADRFVHFARDATSGAWMLRDYVSGMGLSHNDSHLTVAQIEQATTHDEYPPYHNSDNLADWKLYLTLRTDALRRQNRLNHSLTAAPNPASGTWRPLR